MTKHRTLCVVAALLLAAPAAGQSLADVARKEAERRGAVPAPGKVYTNEDLTPDLTAPPPPPAPAPPSPASDDRAAMTDASRAAAEREAGSPMAAPSEADGVTPLDEQEPQRATDKNEGYWRERSAALRARLAAQNRQIESLRQRIASFAPGAAVPERDVAERALAKALEDQRFLQDEWTRFEGTARDRGIPDAWIRQ